MSQRNGDLQARLTATFRVEADEHVRALSAGLTALESGPAGAARAEIVERVFREAHSLKGAARAVNFAAVEALCGRLENVFAAMKAGTARAGPEPLDLLHRAVDALPGLAAAATGKTIPVAAAVLIDQLDAAMAGAFPRAAAPAQPTPAATAEAPRAPRADTVRVPTAKLDTVMRQAEELLAPQLAAGQRAAELHAAALALASWKKERAQIQPSLRRVERAYRDDAEHGQRTDLTQVLEYLETDRLRLRTLESRLAGLETAAARDARTLAGMAEALHHDVKDMQLLPFGWLLESFPSFVRDLAREQGKEVELALSGREIEVDRRILEEMKAPLIHLLRNGLDHGVESPEARRAAGKPARGTITVAVAQRDSGKVELCIADDGAGIDVARVRTSARRLGLMPDDDPAVRADADVLPLVFRSGLSTSPIISDVSGRGLGLAIVREKVERLGGTIELESRRGAGATFRITLPTALALFRGVLVRAGGRLAVIPDASVQRVVRVADADVRTVENRETIAVDGRAVALARLADVLELPRAGDADRAQRPWPAIVLGSDRSEVAFRLDELVGEQDVLVKPLGPQLARVRNLAGVCLLGTGELVPVLNVADLLKSAARGAAGPVRPVAPPPPADAPHSILVAEDSITSRSLLTNILESAGYRVVTAIDGAEAWTALRTDDFDLVVSDVEMPRMDGFELTAKIRADRRLAELPVVLVTALGSRAHRERGIDVGANAYIVKSDFDQSNLLDILGRLLGPPARMRR